MSNAKLKIPNEIQMPNVKLCSFCLLVLLIVLPLFADAPGEWIYLKPGANPLWQDAIGVFIQPNGDTSLVVLDMPGEKAGIIYASYDPSDTNICPMSAYGYWDWSMQKTLRRYPLLEIKDGYAKIIYNVNTGASGWVKTNSEYVTALVADSMSFLGRGVIYLATVGAQNYHSVAYFDKPNRKLKRWKTIMPFTPPKLDETFAKEIQESGRNCIGARGYGCSGPDGYFRKLYLGVVIKIEGDWAQVGDYIDMDGMPELSAPKGWIRIRDKRGKLLVWFVSLTLF